MNHVIDSINVILLKYIATSVGLDLFYLLSIWLEGRQWYHNGKNFSDFNKFNELLKYNTGFWNIN